MWGATGGLKVNDNKCCIYKRPTNFLEGALPRRVHRIVHHALTVDDCYDIAWVILSTHER